MTTEQVIAVAEVVAVFVAGTAVYITLRGLRHELWLQTFAEYTRRYSEIVMNLPSESRRPGGAFDLSQLGSDQRNLVLNSVRAYLNLYSEEFYLKGRGRIDGETWDIWKVVSRRQFGCLGFNRPEKKWDPNTPSIRHSVSSWMNA